jgi:hypothetical protein
MSRLPTDLILIIAFSTATLIAVILVIAAHLTGSL